VVLLAGASLAACTAGPAGPASIQGGTSTATTRAAAASSATSTASTSSAATSAAAGSPAVINVVYIRQANVSLAAALKAQAAAFNRDQHALHATFQNATGVGTSGASWPTKRTAMLASGTAPDCFELGEDELAGVASTGSLLNLSARLARDAKEVNPNDFFPAHLEAGKWQGNQVALPPDGCAILQYYNINAFQAAGVTLPKADWTWNDYLNAAMKLTKKDAAGQVVQAGEGTVFTDTQLLTWLWSNGGDVFSPDFKQVLVKQQPVVDAVQFVVDLVQKYGVTVSSPGVKLGPNVFPTANAAMFRANRGFFGTMQPVSSFTFDVVPLPRSPGTQQSVTFTAPGLIAIAKANVQPEAAWTWLKFLTGTEAEIIRSKVAGGCPSRQSATQDPSYTAYSMPSLASAKANATFAQVLQNPQMARFVPKYVAMDQAVQILSKHVTAAMQGQQSVSNALDGAQQELAGLLKSTPQPAG